MEDCRSVLDIGCDSSSLLRLLDIQRKVGVDIHETSLKEAAKSKTHHDFFLCTALAIHDKVGSKSFDCCIALDVIEHLSKPDGYKLIQDMEKIARIKVVIFTPNEFLSQYGTSDDFQRHRSGWSVSDMKNLGYTVTGMLGPRALRGVRHRIRFRPRMFWFLASQLMHYLYTRKYPEKAAALLCIKALH